MSKTIHIWLGGAPAKTRDTAPFKRPSFGIDDIAIGGTVIYKDGSIFRISKAVSKSANKIKLVSGREIGIGDVWSTDLSDWRALSSASADAEHVFLPVDAVEKFGMQVVEKVNRSGACEVRGGVLRRKGSGYVITKDAEPGLTREQALRLWKEYKTETASYKEYASKVGRTVAELNSMFSKDNGSKDASGAKNPRTEDAKDAEAISYKGYEIKKTGKTKYDYAVNLDGRTRWGSVEELKADIDQHKSGGLPSAKRGGN